jgi:25S rRNA (cytosine2278-C5)-methyltransferase
MDKIYAFERDSKRFKTLETRCKKAIEDDDISKIQPLNQDFIEQTIPDFDPEQQKIKLIICDPSCSGSGMKLHISNED